MCETYIQDIVSSSDTEKNQMQMIYQKKIENKKEKKTKVKFITKKYHEKEKENKKTRVCRYLPREEGDN